MRKASTYMLPLQKAEKLIAKKRMIVVGELYNELIEVKSGLAAGDQLITDATRIFMTGSC